MTDISTLRRDWERHGEKDPLWAILTREGAKGNRWDPAAFFETGRQEVVEKMGQLEQLLGRAGISQRYGMALDVGCGVGRVTQALASHFQSVSGIDISAPMIERARHFNLHGEKVRYLVGPGDSLAGIADASMDFIWCFIVLQHMPPVFALRYVAEFGRVLAPGGIALFQVPSRPRSWKVSVSSLVRRLAPEPLMRLRRLLAREPVMEMHAIAPQQVRAVCEANGLRLINESPDGSAGPHYDSVRYTAIRR